MTTAIAVRLVSVSAAVIAPIFAAATTDAGELAEES